MASNTASHRISLDKDVHLANQGTPSIPESTRDAKLTASRGDTVTQSATINNVGDNKDETKPKTERELKKEREKAEKQKKFEEKKAKQKASGPAVGTKPKDTKKSSGKLQSSEYIEQTPKGQKKILQPLDDAFHKAYIPKVVESAWYDWWEAQGYLQPEFDPDGNVKPAGSFVIVIPPPNVTGALHCGHALATALQDTLIRWHRMRGFTTLFLPGCDHAGISTQSVVENMLRRRQNKSRHDLGRTKFIETVQEWKEEYHTKINNVLRRLGASLDWTREAFTMDANLSAAVTETFVRFHDEGYIYRENRLVNWCTELNTALSNLEVDNKELTGTTKLDVPGYQKKIEFGSIWHFKYPIEGSEDTIEVATTRPETMLGDTAVAVHPNDERFKHLIGKYVRHPFIPNRKIPIIGNEYADPEKGTGAVKITPAHDPNDFKIGKKHGLEFINILNDNGTLNSNAGSFNGQRRFDARYTVIDALEKKGLFVKKENNAMTVPLCAKSKDVIEPLMKPQWWMKMRELADAAIKVVRDGEIKIRPKSEEKAYYRWMENIDDWCLSRQLWWGHQIPAYLVKIEGETPDEALGDSFVVGRTPEEARQRAETKFPGKNFTLQRDEDVLDTWFSSGLWPFSTLGWPRNTSDLQKLYPTSVLETGWDILFFWVARMIIFGVKLTGKVPFTEVYCHTLIRDSEGRKMSKSLGNVIDPIDMMEGIELKKLHEKLYVGNLDPKEIKQAEKYQKTAFPDGIAECGTDALRFALVHYTTGGEDIKFDIKVIVAYRHFCNKIYQATKYVLGNIDGGYVPAKALKKHGNESLAEAWILSKLTTAAKEMNKALEQREFAKSTQIAYQYWYDHLCDVYIENSKTIIRDGTEEERRSATDTLYSAIEFGLLLLHPMMPFITEELWQRLPRRPGDTTPSIMRAKYPSYDESLLDIESEKNYEMILAAAKGIRNLLAENNLSVAPAGEAKISLVLSTTSSLTPLFEQEMTSLMTLSNCKRLGYSITVSNDVPKECRATNDCDMGEVSSLRVSLL